MVYDLSCEYYDPFGQAHRCPRAVEVPPGYEFPSLARFEQSLAMLVDLCIAWYGQDCSGQVGWLRSAIQRFSEPRITHQFDSRPEEGLGDAAIYSINRVAAQVLSEGSSGWAKARWERQRRTHFSPHLIGLLRACCGVHEAEASLLSHLRSCEHPENEDLATFFETYCETWEVKYIGVKYIDLLEPRFRPWQALVLLARAADESLLPSVSKWATALPTDSIVSTAWTLSTPRPVPATHFYDTAWWYLGQLAGSCGASTEFLDEWLVGTRQSRLVALGALLVILGVWREHESGVMSKRSRSSCLSVPARSRVRELLSTSFANESQPVIVEGVQAAINGLN